MSVSFHDHITESRIPAFQSRRPSTVTIEWKGISDQKCVYVEHRLDIQCVCCKEHRLRVKMYCGCVCAWPIVAHVIACVSALLEPAPSPRKGVHCVCFEPITRPGQCVCCPCEVILFWISVCVYLFY